MSSCLYQTFGNQRCYYWAGLPNSFILPLKTGSEINRMFYLSRGCLHWKQPGPYSVLLVITNNYVRYYTDPVPIAIRDYSCSHCLHSHSYIFFQFTASRKSWRSLRKQKEYQQRCKSMYKQKSTNFMKNAKLCITVTLLLLISCSCIRLLQKVEGRPDPLLPM